MSFTAPSPESVLSPEALARLPLFPLPHVVFFPGTTLPLHVFEPRYRALTRHCLDTGSPLAVPQIVPAEVDDQLGHPRLCSVAGAGIIVHSESLPDGRFGVVVRGICRVRLVAEHESGLEFRVAEAAVLHDTLSDRTQAETDLAAIQDCLLLLARRTPNLSEALRKAVGTTTDPGVIADRLAAVLFRSPSRRQTLLETTDVNERLARVVSRLGTLTAGSADRSQAAN